MGLNKHMMMEEAEIEWELDELDERSPRARELRRQLDELRGVQANYNKYLGEVAAGDPKSSFNEHRAAYERIRDKPRQ